MKTAPILALCALAAPLTVSTLWAQTPTGLTARELFYTAPPKPAPTAAAKPTTPAKAPTVAKAKPARPTSTPAQPEPQETYQASTLSGGARLANASAVSTPAIPLGLRYSILKYSGDDDFLEVDPDLVFRSGDRIRLRVQVNSEAYLYVVMQGSSGAWRLLFPNAESDSGSNLVRPGRSYDIPSTTRFVFDEQPGNEKLFFVLSRTPEAQIDQLIYDLEGRPQAAQPAAAPKPAQKTLMASAALGDPLVKNLRAGVHARDLVFEKVDPAKKPAPKQAAAPESAVYVVNASHSADARLVADVTLQHR